MFWFFIWFLLSAFLIGVTLWSQIILLRQKKAWEAFASRHKLTFARGTFMGSPEIHGAIGAYRVDFFAARRMESDLRKSRFVNVVEITAPDGLFDGGMAGTVEMQTFIQSVETVRPFVIEQEGWEAGHKIFVRAQEAAKAYFTPERLAVVGQILKTRNADIILVFTEQEIVVRVETADPMIDAEKINRIVTRLMGLLEKLRIDADERKALKALTDA